MVTKAVREANNTQRSPKSPTADSSIEALWARREWEETSIELKGKVLSVKDTASCTVILQIRGRDKGIPNQKLRQFISTRSVVHEMFSGILQREGT